MLRDWENIRIPFVRGLGYIVPMTEREYGGLAWAAERYSSAGALWGDSTWTANVLVVPERTAWAYTDALEEEDGSPLVPPCIGGQLAQNLLALWNAIV